MRGTQSKRRPWCARAAAASAALIALPGPASAAPGELDPTFGAGGRVLVDVGVPGAYLNDVATTPEGKVVAVGAIDSGTTGDALVLRFNQDGSLDTGFGVRRLDLGPDDIAYGVAVQPDGRIVVAGFTSTNADGVVWRLLPDGSPDLAFGGSGARAVGGAGVEVLLDVVVQPDGRVVAGGYTGDGSLTNGLVVRLSSDGRLDPGFDGDGVAVLPAAKGTNTVRSVGVLSDGKVVATGSDPVRGELAVHRLTAAGALDQSFGTAGTVTVTDTREDGVAVRVLPDDSVVALGVTDSPSRNPYLARISAAGAEDTTFGGAVNLGGAGRLYGLDADPSGRLVASGSYAGDGVVTRFDRSGHLDAAFGAGGVAELPGGTQVGRALALQPDGKVVTVGDDGRIPSRPVLARLLGDPAPSGQSTAVPTCLGRPATIVGTPGKDRLRGTPKTDVILALGGADRISGRGGDDLVCAGKGDDHVTGGGGRDVLRGEAGDDRLAGGGGKDRLVGGPGRDVVRQ
jgi:uncharacterized delta-60 repeat protein